MPHPLATIHQDGWTLAAHFPAPVLGAAIYSAFQRNFSALPLFAVMFLIISISIPDQVPGAAWSRWMVQRLRFLRQGLPPEWTDSLGPAYEQGILRAAGTSYRFEHRRIQDHLARSPRAADETLVRYRLLRPSPRLKRRP